MFLFVDFNECSSQPCSNGATCIDGLSGFICICRAGFDGPRCLEDSDECASDPCQNDGVCRDKFLRFECICALGWIGDVCNQSK